MKKYYFSLLTLLFTLIQSGFSAVIYVDEDAWFGSNNGTSWANAYTNLQSGINAANSGDEVWVSEGYYGHSIAMKEGVKIYGGFSGIETLLSQRNWTTNQCIIQGGGSIFEPCIENISNGLTNAAELNGFFIKWGYRLMYNIDVYPKFVNCQFSDNYGGYSGNIDIEETFNGVGITQSTVFDHCSFIGPDGGSPIESMCPLEITNCIFKNYRTTSACYDGVEHITIGSAHNRATPINLTIRNTSMFNCGITFYRSGPVINVYLQESAICNPFDYLIGSAGGNVSANMYIRNSSFFTDGVSMVSDYLNLSGGNFSVYHTPGWYNYAPQDPQFNYLNGNLGLKASSPYLDGGSNAGVDPTDQIGNTRIFGTTVDRSPLEYQNAAETFFGSAPTSVSGNVSSGPTATVTASGGSGGTYTWYDAFGNLMGTGATVNLPAGGGYDRRKYLVRMESGNKVSSFYLFQVTPIPTSITPSAATICAGQSVNISASGGDGTYNWYQGSCNGTLVASGVSNINVSPSTTTTYYVTDGAGCNCISSTITVVPSPTISGITTRNMCEGQSITLTATTSPSGLPVTWHLSNNPLSPTVSMPISPTSNTTYYGFAYNSSSGCYSTALIVNVTVNPRPSASITGSSTICVGSTTQLSPTSGGTWSSSNPGVASVNSAGLVTGIGGGTATFTFTNSITGCSSNPTSAVTVNPRPVVSITGPGTICLNSTTQLSPTTGGTWVSNNPAVASVSNTGLVTGLTAGTATFTFTNTTTGCASNPTAAVTISPTPVATITGSSSICIGATTTLSPTSGGTWTSSNTAVATVTNGGVVTGVSAGSATFTFTSTAGCVSNTTGAITVNPTNTVSAAGSATLCQGNSLSISHTTTGATGIGAPSGLPVGVSASFSSGTITISGIPTSSGTFNYSIPLTGGCGSINATGTITVDPKPSVSITGSSSICVGSTTQLSPTTGGTWTSNNTSVATVNNNGLVTGVGSGTATFTFTNTATGCISNATSAVTVNANPTAPIVGAITQPNCATPTGSVALSGLPSSGSWTLTASPGGLTMTGSGTSATFSGLSANTTYTFTASNSNNCTSSSSSNAVINAIPGAPVLGGTTAACVGATANVSPTSGGTWSSSNTSIATVTNAGVVTGISAGSVTLTFTDGTTGCSNTLTFTVNALPSVSITGSDSICIGQQTQLSPSTGGTWVSSNTAVATVNNSGLVTGISAGSATFTFTQTSTGCSSNASPVVTVLSIPTTPSGVDKDTICAGQSISISANVAPGMNVNWYTNSSGTGMPVSTSNPYTVSPTSTTTYYAFASNGFCNSDGSLAIEIAVLFPPAPPTGDTKDTICVGDTASLLVSLPTAGSYVEWYDNASGTGSPISNENPLLVSPSATTTYYAFATNGYCYSDGALAVTVYVLPIPTAPSGVDSISICLGDSVALSASAGGFGINWYNQIPGSILSTNNPWIVYPTSDTTFYAYANNGYCQSSDSLQVDIYVLPVPNTPSADTAHTICVGDSVVLQASLDPGASAQWYDNNGVLVSTQNPWVIYPTQNTSLNLYSFNGVCASSNYLQINISVLSIPNAPLGDTLFEACQGDSILISMSLPANYFIEWYNTNPIDTANPISTQNPWMVPDTNGIYYAYANNGVCRSNDFIQIEVIFHQNPIADAQGLDAACAGSQNAQAWVSANSGSAPYSYLWNNGQTDSLIQGLSNGTYVVTVTDIYGCQDIDSVTIYVGPAMNPSILMTTDSLCANQNYWFSVSPSGTGYTYLWSTGDTLDSILFSGTSPYLSVTVTNVFGCQESDSIPIYLLPVPAIIISYDDTICEYEQVVFIAETNNPSNTIHWFNNSTLSSISLPASQIPDTVWAVTQNLFGCSDTASVSPNVTIHQTPSAGFDTLYQDYLPSLVTFQDSSSADVISWNWQFGDEWTSYLENPKHYFDGAGLYTTILIVSNQYYCVDTARISIKVVESIKIPNVFTPNGDGSNDLFIVPTSGLKNPKMIIFNRWGLKLYETEGTNLYWDGRTNAGSLVPEGSYYYLVTAQGSEEYKITGIVTLLY